MTRHAAAFLLALTLGGCGARDCVYNLAHRDCGVAPVASAFPQDDAICRSYGLAPGTADYAICRGRKRHVQRLTRDASDYGFLRDPILPSVY